VNSHHPDIPRSSGIARFFLDDRVAEGRGDRTALLCGDERYTFAELARLSDRAAAAFRDLGVSPDERVLLALDDRPEWVVAFFAVQKLGAVVVKVSPDLPPEQYGWYLYYSRARLVVTHDRLAAAFHRADAPLLRRVVTVERDWGRLLGRAPGDFRPEETDRDDPAVWLFTTGSTGQPKAAVHTHRSFINAAVRYGGGVIGYREGDVALSVPKLFFGYATGAGLLFPFAHGAACALFPDRATPEEVFARIERHRPTVLVNVPTMVQRMCAAEDASRRDLSSLRVSISAGEALPAELVHRWKATFGVELLDGIGTSEMWHIFLSNRPGQVRPGSVGTLVPGYAARVVDDDGNDCPPGEIGTLWIAGGSRALGYHRDHARSCEVFRGDWYVTGDRFRVDEDGYFWFSGRGDDLLKVGGRWVSPVEIEDCLLRHPAVAHCAVVGHAGADGLVTPLAFLVPTFGHAPGDALAAELKEHVKQALGAFKYPRQFRFVGSLPRNDRGKVDRKALKSALDAEAPG